MTTLPDTLEIAGTVFERVETPDDLACWSAELAAATVSVVIEPAAEPTAEARETVASVLGDLEGLTAIAAGYLAERLREPAFALTPDELALLDADRTPFAEPEAVVWEDGTWMLRFAEAPLRMADPYGIAVTFVGTAPQTVEDLSDGDED